MMQGFARTTLAALLSVAVVTGAFAYSNAERQNAKEFIETKLPPDKKTLLEELAKKAGKTPEEMFLDIAKLTGNDTLGVHGGRPDEPSKYIQGSQPDDPLGSLDGTSQPAGTAP